MRVQNGDGIMEAAWQPASGATLCDNRWHRIIVSKVDSSVILQVGSHTPVKVKKGRKTITNGKSPLYIGGVPGMCFH